MSKLYQTQVWPVEAIIDLEGFIGTIWEPACGNGAISEVFRKKGYSVYSTDIMDHGYGVPNVDFLQNNSLFGLHHAIHDNIITNPPTDKAIDFVKMAKMYSKHKVALLLKTTFLETVDRRILFKDKEFPFKKMYQFVRRLNFYNEDEDVKNKNNGMVSYAWFIWERGYTGRPEIDWID